MATNRRKPISPRIKQGVWDKTKGRCWYCGDEVKPSSDYYRTRQNIDHMTPYSRGGSNGLENLVLACCPCNAEKGAMTLEQYRHCQAERMARCLLDSLPIVIGDDPDDCSPFFDGFYHTLLGYASAMRNHRFAFYGEGLGCPPNDYQI